MEIFCFHAFFGVRTNRYFSYLCTVRVQQMTRWLRQWVLLLASVLSLLSVVIPHHHHRDGMPCYASLTMEQEEGDHSTDTHDCGCHGHHLGYLVSLLNAYGGAADAHVLQIVSPLTFHLEAPCHNRLWGAGEAFYFEASYDPWMARAMGLRAPPVS